MRRLTERDPYWLGEELWTSAKDPDDDEIDAVYEKLKEYEDAEEQGLLIKLPTDIVWCIVNPNTTSAMIHQRSIYSLGMYEVLDIINRKSKQYFTTKKAAEFELEKMKRSL